MGDEGPVSLHSLFTPVGVDFNPGPELLGKKRLEKKVVIPFEIFDPNSFAAQTSKFIEDRQVFGEDGRHSG